MAGVSKAEGVSLKAGSICGGLGNACITICLFIVSSGDDTEGI